MVDGEYKLLYNYRKKKEGGEKMRNTFLKNAVIWTYGTFFI